MSTARVPLPIGGKTRLRRLNESRITVLVLRVLAVVVFFAAWQIASDQGWINRFLFSEPSDVWSILRGWVQDASLASNLWTTLNVLAIGWSIGVAAGAAIGIALGLSRNLRDVFEPFIVCANALPRLLFLPILIVVFGFGNTPKVVLVVMVVIFIVAVTVEAGVREISPDLILNERTLGASRLDLLRNIYLPSLAVWIFTSARTTVGYALQATIASEFIGSDNGLGALIIKGQSVLDVGQIFAALFVMFVLGMVLDFGLGFLQLRAGRWMPTTG
jgi:sulfonate transport system permease protein